MGWRRLISFDQLRRWSKNRWSRWKMLVRDVSPWIEKGWRKDPWTRVTKARTDTPNRQICTCRSQHGLIDNSGLRLLYLYPRSIMIAAS